MRPALRSTGSLTSRATGAARGATAALALLALAGGCGDLGRGGDGEGRGVLVIAVDSLRADHVAALGYDRDTTPTLDQLAAEGIAFEQSFSTAPWLLPSHVSLLTGCDPYVGLRYLPENIHPTIFTLWGIPREVPRVAREFLSNGFATLALADHPWVSKSVGLDAGFQDFIECRLEVDMGLEDVGIDKLSEHLENWLQEQPSDRDWFAYVHLHDLERIWRLSDPRWDTYFEARPELGSVPPVGSGPHAFHAIPHRRWNGGMLTVGQYEARYDGALRRVDEQLGRLFTRLEHINRWDRTTVAVVGTYGVGFGEGWVFLDHGLLADVDLRVPWILRPAAELGVERGVISPALTSLVDVGPTLLDLMGAPVPQGMQGVSQAPVLRGLSTSEREFAVARCGFQSGFAVMDERYCYSVTRPWSVRDTNLVVSWYGTQAPPVGSRELLHDRRTDPSIGHVDLSPMSDPERARILRRAGQEWIQRSEDLRQAWQSVTWPTPADPSWVGGELITGGSPGSPP